MDLPADRRTPSAARAVARPPVPMVSRMVPGMTYLQRGGAVKHAALLYVGRRKSPDQIEQENNDGRAGATQDHHYRGSIGHRARHRPAVPAGRAGGPGSR